MIEKNKTGTYLVVEVTTIAIVPTYVALGLILLS